MVKSGCDSIEQFYYVIARHWTEYPHVDPEKLCVYAYHNEIQYGTQEEATRLLEYVQFSERNEKHKDYAIYKIKFEKL